MVTQQEIVEIVHYNSDKNVLKFKTPTKMSITLIYNEDGRKTNQGFVLGSLVDELDNEKEIVGFFGMVEDKDLNASKLWEIWTDNDKDPEQTIKNVKNI